ncbi:MAG: S-layer homology domain-containing protein, partial [Firmicutes bacterium]|nr:S-layer homology domain-containing protein [Bacillota bacterium]
TIDQNYTFEAYFKPVYLTYAAPNGGGAILAETVSGAPFNGELTATIQADSGHFIHSVIVTENGKETVYDYSGQLLTTTEVKWNITQYDVDIRAYFTPVRVEFEVTEGSGTITTEPALSSGDLHRGELKLQISAAEGYCIGEVIKTTLGESTATDYAAEKLQQLELTENITDDTEFQVTFYPISELNCDIYDSEWGDVFVSVNSGARQKVAGNGVLRTLLKNGASFEIIAYPDDGYVVSDNIAQSDSEAIYGDWKKNRDGSYSLFVDGKAPHLSYKIRFEPCYCSNYATIDHNAWFHDAVRYVLVHKLMQGYSENLFGHADTTTRAQLITILHRMEGTPETNGEIPFTDIPQDTWYTEAVKWAYLNDVTEGTSETTFSPDEPLTREQLVTFLYRYAKDRDYDTSILSDLNGFADHKTVSGYAQDALKWAIAMGIVQGTDKGEIEPKAHATRAQLAAILHRFHTIK